MDGMDEKMLSKRVDRLYRCKNLKDVIAIVDEALQEYEHCIQEQEDGFRSEITKSKKLHLSSLSGEESWSRDAFSNGISFSRIFKCCVQRRNGSDTEPLYPRGADGKSERTS